MTKETVTLYFREGSSDKVYTASIVEQNGGFIVTAAWGRRGSTMQTGAKTPQPVTFEAAKSIFDKLVSEKWRKATHPARTQNPTSAP